MSDVRLQVRAALAIRGEVTSPLRPYLAMCRFIHVSQSATWVLQRGPTPRFARAADGWALDAPALPLLRLRPRPGGLLPESDIAGLWQAQRKHSSLNKGDRVKGPPMVGIKNALPGAEVNTEEEAHDMPTHTEGSSSAGISESSFT